MCVAAIINEPVSLEYLQAMEDDNPHGAGLAWVVPGDKQVTFHKGLTAAEIYAMQERGVMTFPYMLHFRWATQGVRSKGMTHPFPLGPRALFGELRGRAHRVLIHNGTWHNERAWIPDRHPIPEQLIRRASDTAIAAWIAGFAPEVLEEIDWATAVGFVGKDGTLDVDLRGKCWEDYEGNWYSNLQWVPRPGRMTRAQMAAAVAYWNEAGWNYDGEPRRFHYPSSNTPLSSVAHTSQPTHNPLSVDEDTLELDMKLNMSKLDDLESDASLEEEASWEEYIRAKYGHSVADDMLLGSPDPHEPEIDELGPDFMTEDPEQVNSWLARRMLG